MPKQGKLPLVENEVLEYVRRLHSEGCAVSPELFQNHARATARNYGIPACDFEVSCGWTMQFMHRNRLCLRMRTTLCQRLPADSEIKIQDFHPFVIRIRQEKWFLLSQIGNTNLTAINFAMPRSSTMELKGAKKCAREDDGRRKTMVHSNFGNNS